MTSEVTELNHADFAGFWVRFFAVCIDLVLTTPFYVGINLAFGPAHPWMAGGVFIIITIVAYGVFFSSPWQATPGMRILRFYICDAKGEHIGFKRALLWILTSMVGWAVCFGGIVYLDSRFDLRAVQDMLRSCQDNNVAPDDCAREIESIINFPFPTFMQMAFASLALFGFLALIWGLSVALPKDKTGFHNLLCGTRFVKGRR